MVGFYCRKVWGSRCERKGKARERERERERNSFQERVIKARRGK